MSMGWKLEFMEKNTNCTSIRRLYIASNYNSYFTSSDSDTLSSTAITIVNELLLDNDNHLSLQLVYAESGIFTYTSMLLLVLYFIYNITDVIFIALIKTNNFDCDLLLIVIIASYSVLGLFDTKSPEYKWKVP